VVTVSRGIWSEVNCWRLDSDPSGPRGVQKIADWTPKSVIVIGVIVNDDETSEAALAVSCIGPGEQFIALLALPSSKDAHRTLKTLKTLTKEKYRAIKIDGDIVAISDDSDYTCVLNWRTEEYAVLQGTDATSGYTYHVDKCLMVLFCHDSVLVVKARSIELFAKPTLTSSGQVYYPIASHSFGWIDDVGISFRPTLSQIKSPNSSAASVVPISIALRMDHDDPWATDTQTMNLFSLEPNPDYIDPEQAESMGSQVHEISADNSPYLFPPILLSSVLAVRGHVKCTTIILGRHGTSIFVQPRPSTFGLVVPSLSASRTAVVVRESLVGVVFPGVLSSRQGLGAEESQKRVHVQDEEGSTWNCIDYDEERGIVLLGSNDGWVTVIGI